MPKYLWKASYTTSGVKGVAAEGGSARRDAVAKVVDPRDPPVGAANVGCSEERLDPFP